VIALLLLGVSVLFDLLLVAALWVAFRAEADDSRTARHVGLALVLLGVVIALLLLLDGRKVWVMALSPIGWGALGLSARRLLAPSGSAAAEASRAALVWACLVAGFAPLAVAATKALARAHLAALGGTSRVLGSLALALLVALLAACLGHARSRSDAA
jgi:hypothetical protein